LGTLGKEIFKINRRGFVAAIIAVPLATLGIFAGNHVRWPDLISWKGSGTAPIIPLESGDFEHKIYNFVDVYYRSGVQERYQILKDRSWKKIWTIKDRNFAGVELMGALKR